MAMNVSSGDSGGDVMVEMNTTPLIDVMLVLLVMLIITIPVQLHAVNMNMPVGTPPPPTKEPQVVEIYIDFDGTIMWNGVPVADRPTLQAKMAEAAAQPDQPEVHVKPNKLVEYKYVAEVLAESQRHQLIKLGIVGNEQFVK